MKRIHIHAFLIVIIFFSGIVIFNRCTDGYTASLPEKVDFNFHIRPILVQKCFLCHGPDSSSREADLRLDTFEGATALRENGIHAIVPGRPARSEMIRRIKHQDPNEVMPPPESNLSLSPREIELLEKWIDQGAVWKPHWAFIPPKKPKVPEVQEITDVANEIDAFILAKLDEKHLEAVPLANRNALIRRVSYLLTGLPPLPKDIEKFKADESEEAYEKIVDFYINSPHFGERWARHWMDIVRYAETRGHEFDYPVIGARYYRDYLIRAFNEDVPYNQFIKEHLAGDLLENPRWHPETGQNESMLGTVFYTLTEGKHSPVNLTVDETERVDNMIDVTTKTFQALTVACARCHDHKFDPIPTTDYYALYGVMKSSRFTIQPAHFTLEKEENLEKLEELKTDVRKMLAGEWTGEEIQAATLATERPEYANETTKNYDIIGDFRGQGLDGWQSEGYAFGDKTTLGDPVFGQDGMQVKALSEGKASSRKSGTGKLGSLRSPDFIIDKDFIAVKAQGKQASIRIIIDNFQLIQNPIYGELDMRVDDEDNWKYYTVDVSPWKGLKAYVEIIPGYYDRHHYRLPSESFIEVSYALAYNGELPKIPSRTGLTETDLTRAVQNWSYYNSTAEEVRMINHALQARTLTKSLPDANELMEQKRAFAQRIKDTAYFAGITDGFAHNSPVFIRGNYQNLSEESVPRRFLSAIPSEDSVFHSPGSGRLEMAQAIVSADNPLTARVMVNRIWHYLFGRGIVETVDNFGMQGKVPTHPELLDFLAVKFMEEGWSVKKMIKYIVMSNTFRSSVVASPALEKADPENLWLARFPLRRLEAEAIRDGILTVAGNLNPAMYGPSVPIHLTEFMQGRGRPKASGPLDGDGRRSIYIEVRRNFLSPMMLAFDRPIPFSTFGKRNVTNVPAQSLFLMNDPFVVAEAKVMAENITAQKDLGLEEKIQWIYMRAFARPANADEIEKAKAFLLQQATVYDIQETEIEHAVDVWKDYCHTVFNMKEFIYLL